MHGASLHRRHRFRVVQNALRPQHAVRPAKAASRLGLPHALQDASRSRGRWGFLPRDSVLKCSRCSGAFRRPGDVRKRRRTGALQDAAASLHPLVNLNPHRAKASTASLRLSLQRQPLFLLHLPELIEEIRRHDFPRCGSTRRLCDVEDGPVGKLGILQGIGLVIRLAEGEAGVDHRFEAQ